MELSANISYEALHGAPPACEPERQQYFMEKAKKQLEVFKDRLGRPLTCCINTFGCQMNARDSEKLLGILEAIGYSGIGYGNGNRSHEAHRHGR